MESEVLKIFDEQGMEIGTAPRSEVHKSGYWHETFHCWFIERAAEQDYIYFQIRSAAKKDYPNLLDITAAGHILANEDSLDGLREVKEELGIQVTIEELVSLGIIKDSLIGTNFIDKELCHVYLFRKYVPYEKYRLQVEEVSGIVRLEVDDFEKLWFEKDIALKIEGFQINREGIMELATTTVNKTNFVPHEDAYIKSVIAAIRAELNND